jgi:hypothetical protein
VCSWPAISSSEQQLQNRDLLLACYLQLRITTPEQGPALGLLFPAQNNNSGAGTCSWPAISSSEQQIQSRDLLLDCYFQLRTTTPEQGPALGLLFPATVLGLLLLRTHSTRGIVSALQESSYLEWFTLEWFTQVSGTHKY